MNLLVNARDALPNGGNISVTTEHESDHTHADPTAQPIVLTVTDDGIGMDESVLRRAFEPFFTTKSADHGSGLGLATAHAIINRADGHINIESEPTVGTTIRIHLPEASSVIPSNVP